MATKKEKNLGVLIGATVGLILGHNYAVRANVQENEKWKYLVLGGLGGGTLGYLTAMFLGLPNDTVNYQLLDNNELVYHGITYPKRMSYRAKEHRRNGLKFDRILMDVPRPREEARKIEKKLIRRDQPIYNIQHNRFFNKAS